MGDTRPLPSDSLKSLVLAAELSYDADMFIGMVAHILREQGHGNLASKVCGLESKFCCKRPGQTGCALDERGEPRSGA